MIPQPANVEIQVRHCHGLAEFGACIELQRLVWGPDIIVPLPIFVIAEETGGQALGAFVRGQDGEKMVGFTLALAAAREGKPYLHSHMTAVVEDYRDRGVGRRLKLFQRQDALKRGINLIEWTFDPLEIKNAYFNLARLGAVVRRYIPNCYGATTSPLHGGLPTDRLVAEWWLDSPLVESILSAGELNAAEAVAAGRKVVAVRVPPPGGWVHVHVSATIAGLKQQDPTRAARVQGEIREQFLHWFARGYAATTIAIKEDGGNYLLEPWPRSS